jgi:uncharacterized protein (DUF885 family)
MALVIAILALDACGARPDDATPSLPASAPRSAASHEQLARLFERYWDERIAYEDAIAPQTLADSLEVEKRFLAELLDIPREALDADERLSYDIFKQQRESAIEGFTYPAELLPMNPFAGMPLKFAIAAAQSADSWTPAQYDRWLRGADDYVKWTRQAVANMRDGVLRGYTSPRVLIERMLAVLEGLQADTASNVLYTPLRSMPANITAAERDRLTAAVRAVIGDKLLPATRVLHDYLQREYLPKTRRGLALTDLPLGSSWYQFRARRAAGPEAVPADIHRLGLAEVDRLKPRLQAFANLASVNDAATQTIAPMPAISDALAAYEDLGTRAAANLPAVFVQDQPAPYEIRAVDFVPTPATPLYYRAAMPAAAQAAVLFVNALQIAAKPDVAVFLQQAVPGHHLQDSIQLGRTDLPRFRRFGSDPAFFAGWGLYAAALGEEMGMYPGDADMLRALELQMRCAAALVVDTGLHSQGWTRAKALEYLHGQAGVEESEAQALVDEYAAMPGDALSCALGAMKIHALRAKAQQSLGARFDLREFHAQVLKDGAMPLNLLEAKVNTWIEASR